MNPWKSFDDATNLDFYYLLNTGDKVSVFSKNIFLEIDTSVFDPLIKIIPEHPYRKNSTAFKMNVPYLIGTTNDEGGYSLSYYHHPNFVSGLSRDEFVFLLAKSGFDILIISSRDFRWPSYDIKHNDFFANHIRQH